MDKENFLFKEDIEAKVNELLNSYNPALLICPQQIDVEDICNYFEIDIQFINFFETGYLAAFVFESGYVKVKNVDGIEQQIYVEKNTILIDEEEYNKNNAERNRFSIAHELGHYILHSNFLQKDTNSNILLCRGINWEYSLNRFIQVEWQANYFAGCLLIPQRPLKSEVNGLKKTWRYPLRGDKNFLAEDERESTIKAISKKFNTSKQTAEIRLKNFNYI